ncbi:MAG: sedoheptulose 7-phosphate cyclase [Litorimonas sp.]
MPYDPNPLIDTLSTLSERRPPRSVMSASLDHLFGGADFEAVLRHLGDAPAFDLDFADGFAAAGLVEGVGAIRMLRGALNLSLAQLAGCLSEVFDAMQARNAGAWAGFADAVARDPYFGPMKTRRFLTRHIADESRRQSYDALIEDLAQNNPHALYPTSAYRACDGHVHASDDERTVDAVMSVTTFASVRVRDHVLDPRDRTLHAIYAPLGRCVAFVDSNVDDHYGEALDSYFLQHGIQLEKTVYRAMEADKGLATVERMLGDMKRVKVGRHEPVLVMGGGVLADTAGLATSLYGRNTPYVMLSTSIVTGIDAGPSPRTCCDGFGYKNLLGAYHPPVISLTDRHFFGTLKDGWVRHGVAEIIKMAVVKNIALFEDLEAGMGRLVETRFGMVGCTEDDPIHDLSNRILAGALKSYIEAEYDNLYETHQCRPHAYGHTWSPGFEIDAGLLHGHAVSIGMGLGAFLSEREGWITRAERDRILALISGYGLSLWDDILSSEAVMRESHRKMIAKRGGNLVAPLPKGAIGQCGYLDDLTETELLGAVADYRELCRTYPRGGIGIEPLCEDVGLECASAATAAQPMSTAAPVMLEPAE